MNVPTTDVLVVGAGPVGLTAAIVLTQRGHTVTVVDSQPEGAHTSRAAVVHSRCTVVGTDTHGELRSTHRARTRQRRRGARACASGGRVRQASESCTRAQGTHTREGGEGRAAERGGCDR